MGPKFPDYFNQEKFYFSKSREEWLPIEDMPFQQALFSHRKLLKEFGGSYRGTRLYQKFIQKLCPPPKGIRQQLEKYGKACHVVQEPGQKTAEQVVRIKFYRAARRGGKKVTTHKVETSVGSYMEATVPVVHKRKAGVKA